jgi:Glycosyl transferase family 2/Tetratricopeptide repeat
VTPSSKPTVSLCMIVRNEAGQLAQCLAPVASLFDEIVIVDTGSQDATKRVAAQFTTHVFDFAWCDDFAAARNEALRRAHGNWVYWLDADDRVTGENVERLRALIAQLDHQPRAYLMNTVCSSQYACDGVNLVTHVRLFRRHDELRWQGRVHEQLRPEVSALGYELAWSDVQIHHVGYQDVAEQQRKLQRDVRLLRMDYAVDPDDVSTLLHLGLAYFHLGRHEPARQCLTRLLRMVSAPAEHLRQVYGALATMDCQDGNPRQALATLDQGLAYFPAGEYLLYLRADCLYEMDRFAEAKETLLRILMGDGERQYRGGVPGEIKEKLAPRKLAEILRLEGEFTAAETLLRSVLRRFPDDTHSWHGLGRVYLDARQGTELFQVIERLRSCPQGDVFASLLLVIWHLTQRELNAAGALIDQLVSQAPQMPMPRMLRAEWLAQIGAPLADRMHACRDILRLQPGNLAARDMLASLETAHQQATATKPHGWCTSLVLGEGLPGTA